MVEGQAIADAASAVVARDHETPMTECPHDSEAVLRHGTLGIGHVLGIAGGHGAGAIAARIGDHQRTMARQLGRYSVPANMHLRVAVQQ